MKVYNVQDILIEFIKSFDDVADYRRNSAVELLVNIQSMNIPNIYTKESYRCSSCECQKCSWKEN